MTANMRTKVGRGPEWWRIAMWGGACGLLAVPLIAMQFTGEVDWTGGDFLFAAVLLGLACGTIELAARVSGDWAYRGGVILAVAASFLLVWVNGAVGIFGNEGNPANLMFLGVIAIAILGAVFAAFRASGMMRAMLAAAVAQALVSVIGFVAGWTSPGQAGVYEAALNFALFTPFWLASAMLFRRASRAA